MTRERLAERFLIRECTTFEDFEQCMDMQRQVWQFSDLDITPFRSFIVTRKSGGFTYGAFDESGRMLGFSLALPAIDNWLEPYYYSQMLAVVPGYRDAGIGVKLKLAQREHALRTGIDLITWTFDPLQSRNAYLNIVKLGCVIRHYLVNYYGQVSSSVLHRGMDTDRLFPQWWVKSERVTDALAGRRENGKPLAVVEIPRDIDELKARDIEAAREWQFRVRRSFEQYFSEGLYVSGFEAGLEGGNSRYLFYQDEHQEEEQS